ncbi:MAG: helix-turn-helix transcriptional regulator [Oscillibacter sp.]|nr:helix-turn-helix transcriptional regulator [Oscillibacter sp.]
MNYERLGKRIRDERLLLRLTIEQLAERVDKSTNYIGQIERNDGKPSLETIVDIANALGTTVDSLLSDSLNADPWDRTVHEITTLLYSLDDKGKQFILDVVKRYRYHHKIQDSSL